MTVVACTLIQRSQHTLDPDATDLVTVPVPDAPTLQRMSFEVVMVTGEFMLVFLRMF